MKKGIFLILCSVLFLAVAGSPAQAGFFDSDYKWSEDEGRWVFKGRIGAALLLDVSEDYTISGVHVPQRAVANGDFFQDTVHAELEVNYRWTDHISFAATLGYQPHTNGVWQSGLTGNTDAGKIALMPVSGIVQYNFAPYGQIRPYVGVGYHYTSVLSSYQTFKVKNDSGLVAQVGVDWWLQKHWGVNIDIKKYWIETVIDATSLAGFNLLNNATVDPLTIGVGIMYRF